MTPTCEWIDWLHKKETEGRLQLIDCLLDQPATKKDREGGERPNEMMATCDGLEKRQKARGKWRMHPLAINRPLDRLATHKKEKYGCLRRQRRRREAK